MDDTANKYLTLFFQNNSYDWLDGYTQKYGGGFIWRRKLQHFMDIFRFKDTTPRMMRPQGTQNPQNSPSTQGSSSTPTDSLKTQHDNETK